MRNVPNMKNPLLFFLQKDRTPERYHKYMDDYETKLEKELISLLKSIGISSSVKTNKHTLPHQFQIISKQFSETYLNAAFESKRFFKKIVKELLDKDPYKIRFYVLAEVVDTGIFGFVKLEFRYYIHQ